VNSAYNFNLYIKGTYYKFHWGPFICWFDSTCIITCRLKIKLFNSWIMGLTYKSNNSLDIFAFQKMSPYETVTIKLISGIVKCTFQTVALHSLEYIIMWLKVRYYHSRHHISIFFLYLFQKYANSTINISRVIISVWASLPQVCRIKLRWIYTKYYKITSVV
jgi:hypothetical protein